MIDRLHTFFGQRSLAKAGTAELSVCLQDLAGLGLDCLPLPGTGHTLARWQALACVAGHSLPLCKFYEGHTDALAIMAELGAPAVAPGSTWGTWAAEPPNARVRVSGPPDNLRVDGPKAWCSGASVLSHALLSAWDEHDRQQLVAVPLDQSGVQVTDEGWHAVGMGPTASVEVRFSNAEGWPVGAPDTYVNRPGFWHGALGIAACWFGAASALGEHLHAHVARREEPHAQAHLGAVDAALHSAAVTLRDAARQLDEQPGSDAEHLARRCRAHIEACCEVVITHVGRALGAGPYCKDPDFARLMADLPVFVRQSHAERDLAVLGQLAAHAQRWHL